MIDRACAALVIGAALCAALLHAMRTARRGQARHPRLDEEGSVLLGRSAMEMGYWVLEPIGRGCVALRVTANMVSWASFVLAALAGVAAAAAQLGVAALLALLSGACDAIDGMVARATGTASPAGEVLDATLDRYADLVFLGGLSIHYRQDLAMLVVCLAALGGAFVVSYATAKAEALDVRAPRGSMRRIERWAYLVGASALTPLVALAGPPWARLEVPMRAALLLVAVVANASAALRLRRVARALRERGVRACAPAPVPESSGPADRVGPRIGDAAQ